MRLQAVKHCDEYLHSNLIVPSPRSEKDVVDDIVMVGKRFAAGV
jgi:hypothetical protein